PFGRLERHRHVAGAHVVAHVARRSGRHRFPLGLFYCADPGRERHRGRLRLYHALCNLRMMKGATMPNDPLLQLAQDVGSLKSSVKSLRDSQTEAWRKIDDVRGTVTDINRKLDAVLAMEARVKNAEEGVAD